MDLARFCRKPLLGILRGVPEKSLEPLLEAILESGLETVEITMNTTRAPELIRRAVKSSGKRLMIGAGTVLGMKDLRSALDAGASFIVTPVIVKPVMTYCVRHKIPIFPGALVPQHIHEAWQAGATMVKVFPANCFGPAYFKEIKGPFADIKLLACSGVTPENLKDYFSSGADAAAIGSGTFRKDWIEAGKFSWITKKLKAYLKQLPST